MILRIKGVKEVRAKGRTYFYHRRTMTRLPGAPGSPEFLAALRLLDSHETKTTMPGTLGALIDAYRASGEFKSLAPATQYSYERVFARLKPCLGAPLAAITRQSLYTLRDEVAAKHKRHAANYTIQILRLLFSWGVKRDVCLDNPAIGVDKIRRPKDAPVINRAWTMAELDAVLGAAPPWLRVAIALAAYTGLREGDLVRVNWACYDGRTFQSRAGKTGVPVWVPAHKRLRAILDAAPHDTPTIVTGSQGGLLQAGSLRTAVFALLKRLRAEGKVGPGLSIHGLRHTLGTALAEAGCDPPTIATVLGHATTAMAEYYSRSANRRHLATEAMRKLEARDERRPANDAETPAENRAENRKSSA